MTPLLKQFAPQVLALQNIPLNGTFNGPGNFGTVGNIDDATTKFTQIISVIIGVLTISAGIWFIFQLIIGGLNWITSTGDKAQLQSAQKRITHAIIGLVIVISAIAITAVLGQLLDIDILNIDFTSLIP